MNKKSKGNISGKTLGKYENYVRFFDAGGAQNLIYLPKRIKIVKGGNTLLKTKLYGIKFAAEKLVGKWDFWIHLSESDGILRD